MFDRLDDRALAALLTDSVGPDPARRAEAFDELRGAVHPPDNDDVLPLTVTVLPYLFEAAFTAGLPDRHRFLDLLASIGAAARNEDQSGLDQAAAEHLDALFELAEPGLSGLLDDPDPLVRAAVPAVLAQSRERSGELPGPAGTADPSGPTAGAADPSRSARATDDPVARIAAIRATLTPRGREPVGPALQTWLGLLGRQVADVEQQRYHLYDIVRLAHRATELLPEILAVGLAADAEIRHLVALLGPAVHARTGFLSALLSVGDTGRRGDAVRATRFVFEYPLGDVTELAYLVAEQTAHPDPAVRAVVADLGERFAAHRPQEVAPPPPVPADRMAGLLRDDRPAVRLAAPTALLILRRQAAQVRLALVDRYPVEPDPWVRSAIDAAVRSIDRQTRLRFLPGA